MKYAPELYSKALLQLIDETPAAEREELARRFILAIRKNGDWGAIGKIMTALEKATVKKEGGRMVTVEVAREAARDEAKHLARLFSKPDRVQVNINPALVAGARVTIDGERELDQSLQARLKSLFL